MQDKFIKFLKDTEIYNEEVLNYIKPKTVLLDHSEESFSFYGCYPILDDNNILKDIRLCIPKITDDITVSINIHEYVHLLRLYKYLNKEYIESEYEELLPVMYELSYLKSVNNKDYIDRYIDHINEKDNYLKVLLDTFNINKDNNKTNILKNK